MRQFGLYATFVHTALSIGNMKMYCVVVLLLATSVAGAQHSRLQYSLTLRPESAFHDSRYPYSLNNKQASTFNLGIASALEYEFSKRLFIRGGAGFISRKLHSAVHLDQAKLPPPHQSFTQELVTTRSVSYRTLFLPFFLCYRLVSGTKYSASIQTGITGNYLLNAFYDVNFTKYEGRYKKNMWQGYSWDIGMSSDYDISRRITFTLSANYSIINTVTADKFISNRDGGGHVMEHRYLNLEMGVKAPI